MDILIQPLNRLIRAEPGANLLEVLRGAQVPVSHSCMSGRCGTCRCSVVDGEVLESGAEQQRPLDAGDSYVLACQTYLTGPCVIRIPEPDEVVVHPARSVTATVAEIEVMTPDIRRVTLKPARPIEFSPGQYAHLQFARGITRPYSMAGLGSDKTLEFHVRLIPGGVASGLINRTLRPGSTVKVSGPLGCSYLRRRHDGPMLCVAGGTGLAPILSIVRGSLHAGMRNPIHLYLGAASPRDVYGLPALEELRRAHPALTVHVVVASGAPAATHRRGLVTQAIEQDLRDLSGWRAYLCGSPPVVEATALLARRRGIAHESIHADAFYPQGA
jgi:ferredoxin-NAD(P)+ reductase (naphthalene dioxygenase ferredoxin-specific)